MSTFTLPSIEDLQDKFPHHNIERFIAQGGMGAVYLARQTSLNRPVAIKILPKEFGDDEDYRISFETEAKAMAKLNHINLVRIYDFGNMNGMLYIIMEFIPGRSLFDTAHGQKVDQLEAARLIVDMSDGLAHAHSAGILHRDIKPANVLIDDQAKPKIVDFGLARPMGDSQTDGVVFGTPSYTAPEVVDNPYSVDQRSDIFSMGVMLYELLTGGLPGQPFVLASKISQSDIRFDKIIAKAIAPDPEKRYLTADAMSEDLHDLIKNFDNKAKTSDLRTGVGVVVPIRTLGGVARPHSGVRSLVGVRPMTTSKSSSSSVIFVRLLLVGFLIVGGFLYSSHQKSVEAEKAVALSLANKKVFEEKRLDQAQQDQEQARKERAANKERQRIKKEEERESEIPEFDSGRMHF